MKGRFTMKRRLFLKSMIVLFALIMTSCASTPPAVTSSGAPKQPAPSIAGAQNAAISIENFSFNPATLTITAGTTVTWTNNDNATHTIKSPGFNSQDLAHGQTFAFKFDAKGTYDYSCGIHPAMTGEIIVQ
jgi:plastocyanin